MIDVQKLEAELAELTAKNAAASSWGAAMSVREERIKNILRELDLAKTICPDCRYSVSKESLRRFGCGFTPCAMAGK